MSQHPPLYFPAGYVSGSDLRERDSDLLGCCHGNESGCWFCPGSWRCDRVRYWCFSGWSYGDSRSISGCDSPQIYVLPASEKTSSATQTLVRPS